MTDTEKDIAALDIGIHTITAQENKVFIYGEEVKNAEHFEEILAKEYSAMERNKAATEECKRKINEQPLDGIVVVTPQGYPNTKKVYRDILGILEATE